jgi:DNA-binding Lrp family transcriptional regulator
LDRFLESGASMDQFAVAAKLNIRIDEVDMRIIAYLFYGGVMALEVLRQQLELSAVTYHLRIRRLIRESVVACDDDPINPAVRNLNLTVEARVALYDLEAEIRSAGILEGAHAF